MGGEEFEREKRREEGLCKGQAQGQLHPWFYWLAPLSPTSIGEIRQANRGEGYHYTS